MDAGATTATTQLDLLGLPLEIRDDIYEFAVFDLSPAGPFMGETGTTTNYRHMNTNILLTNRKIYWEVRNMIVRRGRLVMVSATYLHIELFSFPLDELVGILGICSPIHPKYRNLCIMNHYGMCQNVLI